MKLAVFGPTGGTGRQLVAGALAAGHTVTAFARRAGALEAQPGLHIALGDTRDAQAVERAIAGHDAVLSALGGRPFRREQVCSSAVPNIAAAMARLGIRRFIGMSTHGAGDTRPNIGWLARTLVFGVVLRSEVADKETMEAQLAATDLDWTVVRVGVLTDQPARNTWRAADDGSIRGMGKVSRADVAAFMLAQLEDRAWIRRRPVLVA